MGKMPSANHIATYTEVWKDIQKVLWKAVIESQQPHIFVYAELKKRVDKTDYYIKTGTIRFPGKITSAVSAYRVCRWLAENKDHFDDFVNSFYTIAKVLRAYGFDPSNTLFRYTFDDHRWKAESLGANPFRILEVNFYYMKAEDYVWESIFKYIISSSMSAKYVAENYVRTTDAQALLSIYTDISPMRIHDVYNLSLMFDEINAQYFNNALSKPLIAWTSRANYRKVGSYNFVLNIILLSRILNDRRVPEFAVKFVLYHEMLHMYHGVRTIHGNRYAHTPEFRRDEQKFEHYAEAERALQGLQNLLKS